MVTGFLIAINVVAFLWSSFGNDEAAIGRGIEYGPLVAHGQYWRIFTSAFLHAGVMHIAFNMFALLQIGSIVERIAGSLRMFVIYTIAIVGSGMAVYSFSYESPTLGASGAVFGLFGALVAIGLKLGRPGRGLISQTLPIILINLVLGFTVSNVSNAAHIGGLISGFVAGLVLYAVPRPAAYEDAA